MKTLATLLFTGALLLALTATAQAERNAARTLAGWTAINPALETYQPMHEEWVPGMGVHWGVPGPHVTVGVGHDDQVLLVEVVYPSEIGWHPWFDQPEGQPMELEGFGSAYTQHIWITERDTVQPGQAAAELPLTFEALAAANPALAQYQQLSEHVPGMGYHHGTGGPGLVLALSAEGDVNAFELIVPAAQGWYPWFDQPEGQPMELPGLGQVYTQHVYVVDRATLP